MATPPPRSSTGPPRRLTIFGASGRTGRHLVDQALAAGDQVTAVVRDRARLPLRHDRLRVVAADVMDPAALMPAVTGADAVLSVLGPHSRHDTINAPAVRSILTAMHTAGVRRIVALSAAPIADPDPADTLPYRLVLRPLVRAFIKDHYADLTAMEDALRHSDTDWTVVRPPKLNDKSRRGEYRTARNHTLRRARSLARADLADCMLRLVSDDTSQRAAVAVAY
jgi:putative NADH-flavin reductase